MAAAASLRLPPAGTSIVPRVFPPTTTDSGQSGRVLDPVAAEVRTSVVAELHVPALSEVCAEASWVTLNVRLLPATAVESALAATMELLLEALRAEVRP